MSRVQWYYQQTNQVYGPLEFDELWERAQSGALHPHDLIRAGETGEWQPASSVDGLIPAPVEAEELNDLSELNFQFVNSGTAAKAAEPGELTSLDDLRFEFVQDAPVESNPAPPVEVAPALVTPTAPMPEGPLEWYFQSVGQELGPMSLEEILRRAANGEIATDDMVKKGERGEYRPASRFPQVYNVIPEEDAPSGPLPVEPEGVDYAAARRQQVEQKRAKQKRPRPQTEQAVAESLAAELLAEPMEPLRPATPVTPPIPAPAAIREPEPHVPPAPVAPVAARTSNPVITTPAVITPAKPAFVPPAKKKSSGPKVSFDFSGVTAALGEQKKLMMTLGGLLLVFVLWKCLPLIGLGSEGKYYNQLDALYTEFKSLRDKKASEAEWQAFSEKARGEVEPIVKELKKTAGAKNRTAQELLWASRDYFTPMLTNCRTQPDNNEKLFTRYMENARRLLDGASPAEIRQPNPEEASGAQNQQANRNGGPE